MKLEPGLGRFEEAELLALQNGRFELHCLKMELRQDSIKQPRVYSGPGNIRQSTDGSLEFNLYAKESTPFKEKLTSPLGLDNMPPGTVIPEDKFFTLTAIDLQQRQWYGKRILPDVGGGSFEQKGTFCTGHVEELTFKEKLKSPLQRDHLLLWLSEKAKFPYNDRTKITKEVGDRPSAALPHARRNVLHFFAAGLEFYISTDLNTSRVMIISKTTKFPRNIKTRIIETLQFVLARPVSWFVMSKYVNTEAVISIRIPRPKTIKSQIQPPINIKMGKHIPFCTMFDRYLQHVQAYHDDTLHPISGHMRAICRSSNGSVNAEILVLCIAIESLLKSMKEATPDFTKEEKSGIEKAKKCIKSLDIPQRTHSRLMGLFGLLNNPSVSSALRTLAQSGVVIPESLEAWKRLRHKVAHGDTLSDIPLQTLISLRDKVLVLFYQLVFHQIGYQGKYTDYSKDGWPDREYPLSIPNQEE